MDIEDILASVEQSVGVLRQRLMGFDRLLDITRSLAAEIDLDRILSLITREACDALGCDRATLFQFDAGENELFTRVATELEIAEIRSPLGRGIAGDVARTRQAANVPDPRVDPRWRSEVDEQTGYHTRNLLAVPVVSQHDGSLLGVLELINKIEGSFGHFDEQLLLAFSQHAAVALDRARLVGELRKQEAVAASLDVARGIQRGFMPERMPEVAGYEVATWWFPNQAVGGDYCDVLRLRDGRLGLVIADVSGHGIGPSLLMASVRAALRALTLEHSSPDVLLGLLASALSTDLQNGRFITMVMACLDPRTHVVEFANAGHAPAEHYSAARDCFASLESTGLPLGVEDRAEFPRAPAIRIQAGDLVLLCTDGIVEAMNADHEMFGDERLKALARECRHATARELVERIGAEVTAYYEGDSPPDDLTVLAVKRLA